MQRIRQWLARWFYRAAIAVDVPGEDVIGIAWTRDFSKRVIEIETGQLRLWIPLDDDESKNVADALAVEAWEARATAELN